MTIKITEIDVSKGTQEERVLTGKEAEELLARQEKMTEKYNALLRREVDAQAKKAAAEAKLAALGLTADDLKALGLGGN